MPYPSDTELVTIEIPSYVKGMLDERIAQTKADPDYQQADPEDRVGMLDTYGDVIAYWHDAERNIEPSGGRTPRSPATRGVRSGTREQGKQDEHFPGHGEIAEESGP